MILNFLIGVELIKILIATNLQFSLFAQLRTGR